MFATGNVQKVYRLTGIADNGQNHNVVSSKLSQNPQSFSFVKRSAVLVPDNNFVRKDRLQKVISCLQEGYSYLFVVIHVHVLVIFVFWIDVFI